MHTLPRAARRGAPIVSLLLVIATLAACGGSTTDEVPAGTAVVENGSVEITADDLEFNVGTIEAPAGAPFTVVFRNLETVPHNWSIYTEEGGSEIAVGEVIGEGATDEVEVPALEPGTYFFVCDVHPAEMTGTVVIEG